MKNKFKLVIPAIILSLIIQIHAFSLNSENYKIKDFTLSSGGKAKGTQYTLYLSVGEPYSGLSTSNNYKTWLGISWSPEETINLVRDKEKPEITCGDVIYDGELITFSPEVYDPEPSSGLESVKICQDAICENILCEITENSCSINSIQKYGECTYKKVNYWVYAKDRAGNANSQDCGKFTVKKEIDCPCSFNSECISGLCKGAPPLCMENPIPIIYIV